MLFSRTQSNNSVQKLDFINWANKPKLLQLKVRPPPPLPYLPRKKAVALCQSELSPINIMELDKKRKTQYVGTTQVQSNLHTDWKGLIQKDDIFKTLDIELYQYPV